MEKKLSTHDAIMFGLRATKKHLLSIFMLYIQAALVWFAALYLFKMIITAMSPEFSVASSSLWALISMLGTPSLDELTNLFKTYPLSTIISLIALLAYSISYLFGWNKVALDIHDHDKSSFGSFLRSLTLLPTAFVAYLLFFFAVSITGIFLVVPGIIMYVRLAFFPFFILDKNAGAMESLRMSWNITTGHFSDIFIYMCTGAAMYIICALIPFGFLLNLFIPSILSFGWCHLYRSLIAPMNQY